MRFRYLLGRGKQRLFTFYLVPLHQLILHFASSLMWLVTSKERGREQRERVDNRFSATDYSATGSLGYSEH